MFPSWIRRLIENRFSALPRHHSRRARTRVDCEELESRLAPASTFIWTGGGGADTRWSTDANWNATGASTLHPTGNATAVEDLIFPISAPVNSRNDISNGVFNSITFQGSNYLLTGNALTLGGTADANAGFLTVNGANESITFNITLGGGLSNQQNFFVGSGASVTISGKLSDSTSNPGLEITKTGGDDGILTLTADNSAFTGAITVAAGILVVTNNKALGSTSAGTTVRGGAELELVSSGTPLTISENVTISGAGKPGLGALRNISGNNVWAGTVTMADISTIGSENLQTLTISGLIEDLGSGFDLTKEGPGQIVFTHANTYRGLTTIEDGTLTIRNALALGEGGTLANGTVVKQTIPTNKVATLQIEDPNNPTNDPAIPGLIVRDETITLNGPGVSNRGALRNAVGYNEWAGSVLLGSAASLGHDVNIGVATNTRLIISGVISDPNSNPLNPFRLTKVETGKLILNNNNTYRGLTSVNAGILNIRDSGALGVSNTTTVSNGAALELEVDVGLDPHGRDLSFDSVTGHFGNGPQLGLDISENVSITGTGIVNTGALRSLSGINQFLGTLTLGGTAAIGVEPDPNPTNTKDYFTRDYSLTMIGNLGGANLRKRGTGQLILPFANTYTGTTDIEEGWITIQNDLSLGAIGIGPDTLQPATTVSAGAALHLLPLVPDRPFNLVKNLVLEGTGISHPFALIDQAGALMSLGGNNVIGGPIGNRDAAGNPLPGNRVSYVQLNGQTGIGVERLDPNTVSELTISAAVSEVTPPPINVNGNASGGANEDDNVIDTGGTGGTVTLNGDALAIPDDFRIYLGDFVNDPVGSILVYDSSSDYVSGNPIPTTTGTATITVNYTNTSATATAVLTGGTNYDLGPRITSYAALPSTFITIVVNQGGSPSGTIWNYTASIQSNSNAFGGGITKMGSRQLILQGDGTYTGDVQINEGVVRTEADTALGTASTGTSSGAQTYTPSTTTVGAGNKELQTFTVTGTTGEFTLTFDGQTTDPMLNPLTFAATAADVKAALEALPNIGPVGGVVDVTRQGTEEKQLITVGNTAGTFALSFGGAMTGQLSGGATASQVSDALNQLLTSIGAGGFVTVDKSGSQYTVTFQGGLRFGDQPSITVPATDPNTANATITEIQKGTATYSVRFGGTLTGTDVAPLSAVATNGTSVTFGPGLDGDGAALELGTAVGPNEEQTLTTSTVSGTPFSLTFGDQVTVGGTLLTGASAQQLQAALNGLANIGGVGGSVTVTRAQVGNTYIYTIRFLGTLSHTDVPQLVLIGANGSVTTAVQGGIAGVNGGISEGLAVWYENLVLTGTGNRTFNDAALNVRSGDHFWQGGVTLANNALIHVEPSARVIMTGTIDDGLNPANSGSSLTIEGGGQVLLAGSNTYRGTTYVDEGILVLQNSKALGATGISGVQTVRITGDPAGDFTLSFKGEAIATPLSASASAQEVQDALNLLTTLTSVGGSVSVSKSGTVYTITFQGSLAGTNQPLLVAQSTTGADPVVSIAGGTVVADGAAIQLQGSLTVAGEPLVISGEGNPQGTPVPVGWIPVGPAPINNYPTVGNQAVSGRITGSVTDAGDPNVIYVSTADGGVWRSVNGGQTWQPMFDFRLGQDETQAVTITATTGNFTLEFMGAVATLPVGASALEVQTALNSLATIGGLEGFVSVSRGTNATNNDVYTIRFRGRLGGTDVADINVVTGGFGLTVTPGIDAQAAMFIGTIAIDPTNSRTLYIGTGETNNSSDSFYGTGIYKSTDAGLTWSLVSGVPIQIVTVQNPGGSFQLSFNGGALTNSLNVSSTALQVEQELNALATIRALGPNNTGSVSVSGSSGVFTIRFNVTSDTIASLFANNFYNIPKLTVTNAGANARADVRSPYNPFVGRGISKIVVDPFNPSTLYVASGDSGPVVNGTLGSVNGDLGTAGIWRFMNGDWFDLTAVVSGSRQSTPSQSSTVPNNNPPRTPGPDDDYRVNFPQTNVVWSDVALIYTDVPNRVPYLFAAVQGGGTDTLGRTTDGGVFWTSQQQTDTPSWYLGAPAAAAKSEVQRLTFNNTTNPTGLAGTDVVLDFNGAQMVLPVNLTAVGMVNAANLQTALNSLATIGGLTPIAGNVTVTFVSSTATQQVFDVAFSGGLSNLDVVPIGGTGTAGTTLTTTTTTQGGTGVDNRSGARFPTNPSLGGIANGNIKISGYATGTQIAATPPPITIFASVATPAGALRGIYKSTNGGQAWSGATIPGPGDYLNGQGEYANAILALRNGTVYVGGHEFSTGSRYLYRSTDAGATYSDISVLSSVGPHTDAHNLQVDASGRLLVSTDGGLWRLEPGNTWTDLNGNLTISQVNSIASDPRDLSVVYADFQSNGTALFGNGLDWTSVDGSSGGDIRVLLTNPAYVYHIQFPVGGTTSTVRRRNPITGAFSTSLTVQLVDAPLVLDQQFTTQQGKDRLLAGDVVGGRLHLKESTNGGTTWSDLFPAIGGVGLAMSSTGHAAIAISTFQGPYVADPAFGSIPIRGANQYDPDTIYVTNGTSIYLTKDHGITWTNRSIPVALQGLNSGNITELVVDPRNRDTIYAVRNVFGGHQVFKSTDAGQTWTDLTLDLPDLPVWQLVLDPRSDNLYIGTDQGVYLLENGSMSWRPFGEGMPNVQVRDLELNQTTNTLLAGTSGRGVFRLWLDETLPNAGALRVPSGTSVWTGPIFLAGDTTIRTDGTQDLQTGISAAQLLLQGTVSDAVPGGNYTLTKTGQGNLFLSGSNTYGGLTEVQEGVLVVTNANSLGQSTNGTEVFDGAQLQLRSNLNAEPLTLHGDGYKLDDHFSGALYNFSGNNVYSNGSITLAGDVTIGVALNSSLKITRSDATPVITDGTSSFQLTKELTGTLELAAADDYDGLTRVNQGVLRVSHGLALGGTAAGTEVLDGAQLQMAGNITVAGETLHISGTGIQGTGALLNFSDTNTWQGPVNLDRIPGFKPATTPPNFVSFGANANSSLTIDGIIDEDPGAPAPGFGLTKVGPGKLILTQDNQYNLLTDVKAGTLRIRHGGALGTTGTGTSPTSSGTLVESGAALEIETPTGNPGITVTAEEVTLNGKGVSNTGALRNISGDNTYSGNIILSTATSIDAAAGSLNLTGVVKDPTPVPATPATLDKIGNGTVILSNTNTYTGLTTLFAGKFLVNGSTGNIRLTGGTLGGSGNGTTTGVVGTVTSTAGVGGVVSPGNSPGTPSPGTLTTGTDTWNSNTTFFVELVSKTPSIFDQLKVNGNINLGNAKLDGTVASTVLIGDTFTIISATGTVTGRFNGLPNDGDVFTLGGRNVRINYTANSVTLTALEFTSTTTLTASPPNPTFGQSITLTASVTPNSPVLPTGLVTFYDTLNDANPANDVLLGMVTLNGSAQAMFPLGVLPIGTYGYRADYEGDASYLPSSGTLSLTVSPAATTTTLASIPNTVYGEPATFSATVINNGTSGPATGMLRFVEVTASGDVILDTETLNGSGMATFSINTLGLGSHTIRADYLGTSNLNASSSDGSSTTRTYMVSPADTNITLGSSKNASVVRDSVTFTVTVTPQSPSTLTPVVGSVTIIDTSNGNAVVGMGTLNSSGQFTVMTSSLTVGTHDLQANFTDASGRYLNNSATLSQMVNQIGTMTAIVSSANPSTLNSSVTFTATVSPTNSSVVPTGMIEFRIDGNVVDTKTLDMMGKATYSISSLGVGNHPVSATYSPDADFAVSGPATLTQTIGNIATTTTVSSSDSTAYPTQAVTFTATIGVPSGSNAIPTGTVTFFDTFNSVTTMLGSTSVMNFQATLPPITFSATQVGTHEITATFTSDDPTNIQDSSTQDPQFVETVAKVVSTTTLTSSDTTAFPTQNITFTATVSGSEGGVPGGTVTFKVDGGPDIVVNVMATPNPNEGKASFTTSFTAAQLGSHTITASYSGTDVFTATPTPVSLNETVAKVISTTTLTSSDTSAFPTQNITFTATVSGPEGGVPDGMVTFKVDGGPDIVVNVMATPNPNEGNASFTTSFTAAQLGSHTITASYSGSDVFTATPTPVSLTETVAKVISTTTLASSDTSAFPTQNITFTATVSGPEGGVPGGMVTFKIDGGPDIPVNVTPTGSLNQGHASFTTSFTALQLGSHTITASYSGSDVFTATPTPVSVAESVAKVPTNISLVSSDNTSFPGQSVTFTATVTANEGGAPGGKVAFQINGGPDILADVIPTGTNQGQATLTTSTLDIGIDQVISARYNGTDVFLATPPTAVLQSVASLVTTTTLSSSDTSSFPTQEVTFTATIGVPPGNGVVPTGTVTFKVDGNPVTGSSNIDVTGGQATFSTSSLGEGTYTITADYMSDGDAFASSSATPLTQTVSPIGTTTTLSSTKAASAPGESVTFTAAVKANEGVATGSVIFQIDGGTVATVSLNGSGQAFFSTGGVPLGAHTITAIYSSDTPAFASSSASVGHTVKKDYYAVGTDAGTPALVKVYDANTGAEIATISPFDGFLGGVRVAVGDVNGDGYSDIIIGAGPGAPGGHVKVFSGNGFGLLGSYFAFEGFMGGVTVAAGDINGDGTADILVGAGPGAPGGHVRAFSFNGTLLSSYFAFPGFTGGVTVAAGDLDGDGRAEIIVGAGPGAPGGHVKAFTQNGTLLASFFAYAGFTGGVNVAAGDIDGDGRDEIITGAASVITHVKVIAANGQERASFVAYPGAPVGVRVGSVDRNNDGHADIITGAIGAPHVKLFDGVTLGVLDSFFAFLLPSVGSSAASLINAGLPPTPPSGVFVGGSH
jgi:autotransporter-associated beta strand protein